MLTGRTTERDALNQALSAAQSGSGRGVFLGGEPGIGKSTLLACLRQAGIERRFAVAEAVAERGWSLPYAPWVSILDQLGIGSVSLAASPAAGMSADDYRQWAHRSVLTALRDAASRRPVLLVLDDLQWVDQSSRDLLLHVLRGTSSLPVLCAGSWRNPLSQRTPDVQAFVANLRREPATTTIDLAGLDAEGITAIVDRHGWSLSPKDIQHLAARTNGNPFFVTEMARAAAAGGSPLAGDIPPSIRQVVQLRIAGLDEATQQVLRVAAIFQNGFDFDVLRAMADLDEDDLLAAIDHALDQDLLRSAGGGAEHYNFAHAIVREAIVGDWSPSRRVRLHRRAAETLEQRHAGQLDAVVGDLAMHYHASRSLDGSTRGIPYACAAAARAASAFDHAQAARFYGYAADLAVSSLAADRAGIETSRAVALADSLDIDAAVESASRAAALLQEADGAPDMVAGCYWRMAHALNAVGAPGGIRRQLCDAGIAALGDRRDIHWARLRLLDDPIAVVENDTLYVTRWLGYDPEARRLALQSVQEDDQVQTVESYDPRTPAETRALIALARSWANPRSTLRGLTAAANDLTYRHGDFQPAIRVWNEVLSLARLIGAAPWQANALNQITLLQVTLGQFEEAAASKYLADQANAELGVSNDTEALEFERNFAVLQYLGDDWSAQATYWLQFVGEPPHGLEAQLATPLYAAMAASAAARAGNAPEQVARLVDAVVEVASCPGIMMVNGVVAWAADAIFTMRDASRAAMLDRLAAGLIRLGVSDYPQTSLHLTRARMHSLLGSTESQDLYETARRTLAAQGQTPLLGIACYEQAHECGASPDIRRHRLDEANAVFARLGMTGWLERTAMAIATPVAPKFDLAGISRREFDVLQLVARGYSDRRIADDLYISERTVHAHMRSMLGKTGVGNRTELAHWAGEKGILDA